MSKIDVHHHFYPPFFTEVLNKSGGDPSGWIIPPWSLETDMKFCDELGIRSIFTMTAPGASILSDPAEAANLARAANEAAAAIRDAHPKQYGFFASLPSLLDTSACLSEIEYSLDTLHADGIILFTRYGTDNHYLGHADFVKVWEALNERSAVVFIHPTHAVDTNLVSPQLPAPMLDYPHETGRSAMDLILSGRMAKTSNCKIILSHAGGTLPYLIYRAAGMIPHTPFGKDLGLSTEDIVELGKRFYFDTAISANEVTLAALFKFARPGHVLFGTDYPNAPREGIDYFTRNLDGTLERMGEEIKRSVRFGAAEELFPRLKA
ncbi:amidohydrolase 2 [Favolaschia claudopus]|uniref:6-methylsalicylate decarboxylase n=1 Tax=Favolaschia claudopus TaxID=2862362 RepID=A0AAW0DUE0_9AGAR